MDSKALSEKYNIQLPSKVKFEYDEEKSILKLTLNQKSLWHENMQEDNAAFESWIFCLLPHMPKGTRVELDWAEPEQDKENNGHYRRFLFRIIKMQEHFSWFRIPIHKQNIINIFKKDYYDTELFLNVPSKEAKDIDEEKSESFIEQIFVRDEILKQKYNLTTVNRQLPVGVFYDKVSKENHVFTCGKSAIDLWGIKEDVLYIFELKFQNKMTGIITEALFYLWVMEDLIITKRMKYEKKGENNTYRDFNKFHNAIGKISKIKAVLLYDEIHRNINENVINFINKENDKKMLELSMCKYRTKTIVEICE